MIGSEATIEDSSAISVVIPTFNSAETISRCIQSVISQTVPVGEIIVVDDGSSDKTVELVMAYSPMVQLVEQENQGPSSARNHGVSLARGSWVAFLDGDDYWHESKIELQIEEVNSLDRCDLLAAAWTRGEPSNPAPASTLTPVPYVSELLLNRFQTSTVLMRRSLLEAVGGFRSDFDGVEDWHQWLKATELGVVIVSGRILVHYHDSPSGVSKKLATFYRNMNRMLDEEQRSTQIDRVLFAEIRAWHYQRMVVAFLLAKMPIDAARALIKAGSNSSPRSNLDAFVRHLVPFLLERLRQRRSRSVTK